MSLLIFGSSGDEVKKLQGALNLEGTSRQPTLAEDGIFGSKTRGRVMEFQQDKHLMVDGKVGPQTREALKQWLELIEKLFVNLVTPKAEADARNRIVSLAFQYHNGLGWRPDSKLGDAPSFFRIAANRSADGWLPTSLPPDFGSPADRRLRQGGMSLATIFQIAWPDGPGMHKVHEISTQAIRNYQQGAGGRNIWDIPSWCGVFAMYVYRSAGLKVRWPALGASFRGVPVSRPPKPGDYGNIRAQNHFFIVTAVNGNSIETVEGNMTRTIGGISVQTIIRSNSRTISEVRAKPNFGFFEPRWEVLLK